RKRWLRDPGEVKPVADQFHEADWTFLSNHSHVLYCISFCPDIRMREIATKVRITERAVQRIVVDLERAGYLKRERVGRQNHYRLEPGRHLRHPLEHHVEVGRLLTILQPAAAARQASVKNPQASARARKAMPARVQAKAIAHSKKPNKSRKRVARKSV